jgi:hypothetical protein
MTKLRNVSMGAWPGTKDAGFLHLNLTFPFRNLMTYEPRPQ